MSSRILAAALAGIVVGLAPAAAFADDVEPPPVDCPAGTSGRASHAGPHCRIEPCTTTCPAGLACVPGSFCLEHIPCGGRRRDEGDCTVEVVRGTCDAARACARGTCEIRQVCLPPTAAVPPATTPLATASTTGTASSTAPAPAPAPTSDGSTASCAASPRSRQCTLAMGILLALAVRQLRRR